MEAMRASYITKGKPKKFIDVDGIYLDSLGQGINVENAKEVLRRFRYDYQISSKKKPNNEQKEMWRKYWAMNH